MSTRPHATPVVIEQLIRASPTAVFSAFVEPEELKKFWLARATAPLELGKTVQWNFKVRGASDTLKVLALEPGRLIRVQWSDRSTTLWTFTALGRKQTLVHIEHAGFKGSREAVLSAAADTAQGFAFVLSDLKVLLERGILSGVVKDKALMIERAMKSARRKK